MVRPFLLQLWNLQSGHSYVEIRTRQEATETYAAACPTFSLAKDWPSAVRAVLSVEGMEALRRVLWGVNEACPTAKYCPLLPCVAALSLLFLSESETFNLIYALVNHSEATNADSHLHWHFVFSQAQHQRLSTVISHFLQSKESKLAQAWDRKGINIAAVVEEFLNAGFIGTLHWSILCRLFCCFLNEGVRVFIRFTLGVLKRLKGNIGDLASTTDVIAAITQALSSPITAELAFNAGVSSHLPKFFPLWQAHIALPDSFPLHVTPSPLHFLVKSTVLEQRDFQRVWQEIPPRFQLLTPTLVYCSETDGFHLPTLLRKSEEQGRAPGIFILGKSLDQWKFGVFVDSWLRATTEFVGGYESCFFIVHPKQSFAHIHAENSYVLHVSESDFTVGEGPHGPALSLDTALVHGYSAESSTFSNEVISTGSFVLQSLELFVLTV